MLTSKVMAAMVGIFVTVVMMAVNSVIELGIENILKAETLIIVGETILRIVGDMEIVIAMNVPEMFETEIANDHLLAKKVRAKELNDWWLTASKRLWHQEGDQRIRSSGAWRHPR